LYDAENWTLRKVDHKHLGSFEMWCWRRMGRVSCSDHVRNYKMLHRQTRNGTVHAIKRKKAYCIGHILCRNCLLKHVIEGNIEVTGRGGRSRKQVLDGLKEMTE
jgi:hypothetical protein